MRDTEKQTAYEVLRRAIDGLAGVRIEETEKSLIARFPFLGPHVVVEVSFDFVNNNYGQSAGVPAEEFFKERIKRS